MYARRGQYPVHVVVLLAEDVDRNLQGRGRIRERAPVVLLAEDVDRNITTPAYRHESPRRPPRGGRG